jgi:hypothetical protein
MPFGPGGAAHGFLHCIVLENIDAQDTQDFLLSRWSRHYLPALHRS